MALKAWLGCLGIVLCVAAACSGSDGKKIARDAGGAGGDDAEPASGGELPSEGGSGGAAVAGTGAAPSEAGVGAVPAEAGAGGAEPGAGGMPSLVGLEPVQGTWTGQALGSYVCETGLEEVQLTIEGASVSSTFPSEEDLGTGQIVHQGGQSFTFDLFIDNPAFNQDYHAQLFVDPTATYALFVAIDFDEDGLGNSVDVALLQREPLAPLDSVIDDYFGDWAGPTFALDANLAVARELDATATFTNESNGDVTGQDDDGTFSGVLEPAEFVPSVYVVPSMPQGPNNVGGMFLLSNDRQAMAVALLRELDANDGALCHLNEPFVDMSVHKFGLWIKQPQ